MRPEHTLKSCTRYSAAISTILNRWPDPTHFSPDSPSTFAPRLRDAIKGTVKYHQNEMKDLVDMEKLVAIADFITISHRPDDTVLAGPKDAIDRYNKGNETTGLDVIGNPNSKHVTIDRIPGEEIVNQIDFLDACACMCQHRIDNFANGVRFVHLTGDQVAYLESIPFTHDITVLRNDDGSFIML